MTDTARKLPPYLERTGEYEITVTLRDGGGSTLTMGEPKGRKRVRAILKAAQSDDNVYDMAQALLAGCLLKTTGDRVWPEASDGASAFGDVLEDLVFSDVQRIAAAGTELLAPDAAEAGN